MHLDPAHTQGRADKYKLRSADNSYSQEKELKDGTKSGDGKVRLIFDGVTAGLSYTLELDRGDGAMQVIFDSVAYADLKGQE